MSGSNDETLQSYGGRVRDYIEGTAQTVSGEAKDWIDAALSGLPTTARILELGSAFGRDAAYIASRGFEVDCTDAVAGFVTELQARGLNARRFNVLTDELGERYDLIFANAVLLHFERDEFGFILKKLIRSIKAGGRLAFSLKKGQGEAWSSEKIGAPRFFCYWERQILEPLLADAGFAAWTIDEARTSRAHAEWLFVRALAP
jgi:SAM-dependent methyltransferase